MPHKACLDKTRQYLGYDPVVEITHKTPYGFDELDSTNQRLNISVDYFLETGAGSGYDVCLLHILLGCGVSLEDFIKVVNKAVKVFNKVIIIEHNKQSKDWSTYELIQSHYIVECLDSISIHDLAQVCGWKPVLFDYSSGNRSDDRNMFIVLKGLSDPIDFDNPDWMFKEFEIPKERFSSNRFENACGIPLFTHLSDVYIGSCTYIKTFKKNIKVLDEVNARKEPYTLYATCGGFFSLEYLYYLRKSIMKKVVWFDTNQNTLDFCLSVKNIIVDNETVQQFLTNYLMCNISYDGKMYGLLPTSIEERIHHYMNNKHNHVGFGGNIFRMLLSSKIESDKLLVYGFKNVGEDSVNPGYLHLSLPEVYTHIGTNKIGIGEKFHWLESEDTYMQMRRMLMENEFHYQHSSLDTLLSQHLNPEDVVLCSNITIDIKSKAQCLQT